MEEIEVSRTKRGKIVVEGGWIATVPSISVSREDPRFRLLVNDLMRAGAGSALVAERVATESVRALFRGGWVTKLKFFVGRAAELYSESYGDLEGFDPERVEKLFLPNADDLFGQRENTRLRNLFTEMRRRV